MAKRVSCTDKVELVVPCKPEYVRSVRTLAADIAGSMRLSAKCIEDLKVAVSEAVSNVVRHAYVDKCSAMPVVIVFQRNNRELTIEVSDQGVGFQPPPEGHVYALDRSREGGLGIILIRELMDGVFYWSEPGHGTRIRMSKSVHDVIHPPETKEGGLPSSLEPSHSV